MTERHVKNVSKIEDMQMRYDRRQKICCDFGAKGKSIFMFSAIDFYEMKQIDVFFASRSILRCVC
jgi:hypothetical protein